MGFLGGSWEEGVAVGIVFFDFRFFFEFVGSGLVLMVWGTGKSRR